METPQKVVYKDPLYTKSQLLAKYCSPTNITAVPDSIAEENSTSELNITINKAAFKVLNIDSKWNYDLAVELAEYILNSQGDINWNELSEKIHISTSECQHFWNQIQIYVQIGDVVTKNQVVKESKQTPSKQHTSHKSKSKLKLQEYPHLSIPSEFDTWDEAQQTAYKMIPTHANDYYYQYLMPGIISHNDIWTAEERVEFLFSLRHYPPKDNWGLFSLHLPGHTGKQCEDFYNSLNENEKLSATQTTYICQSDNDEKEGLPDIHRSIRLTPYKITNKRHMNGDKRTYKKKNDVNNNETKKTNSNSIQSTTTRSTASVAPKQKKNKVNLISTHEKESKNEIKNMSINNLSSPKPSSVSLSPLVQKESIPMDETHIQIVRRSLFQETNTVSKEDVTNTNSTSLTKKLSEKENTHNMIQTIETSNVSKPLISSHSNTDLSSQKELTSQDKSKASVLSTNSIKQNQTINKQSTVSSTVSSSSCISSTLESSKENSMKLKQNETSSKIKLSENTLNSSSKQLIKPNMMSNENNSQKSVLPVSTPRIVKVNKSIKTPINLHTNNIIKTHDSITILSPLESVFTKKNNLSSSVSSTTSAKTHIHNKNKSSSKSSLTSSSVIKTQSNINVIDSNKKHNNEHTKTMNINSSLANNSEKDTLSTSKVLNTSSNQKPIDSVSSVSKESTIPSTVEDKQLNTKNTLNQTNTVFNKQNTKSLSSSNINSTLSNEKSINSIKSTFENHSNHSSQVLNHDTIHNKNSHKHVHQHQHVKVLNYEESSQSIHKESNQSKTTSNSLQKASQSINNENENENQIKNHSFLNSKEILNEHKETCVSTPSSSQQSTISNDLSISIKDKPLYTFDSSIHTKRDISLLPSFDYTCISKNHTEENKKIICQSIPSILTDSTMNTKNSSSLTLSPSDMSESTIIPSMNKQTVKILPKTISSNKQSEYHPLITRLLHNQQEERQLLQKKIILLIEQTQNQISIIHKQIESQYYQYQYLHPNRTVNSLTIQKDIELLMKELCTNYEFKRLSLLSEIELLKNRQQKKLNQLCILCDPQQITVPTLFVPSFLYIKSNV